MIVEKDLKGVFKWVVVDEDLVIVDPKWREEYILSRKPVMCRVIRCLKIYKINALAYVAVGIGIFVNALYFTKC